MYPGHDGGWMEDHRSSPGGCARPGSRVVAFRKVAPTQEGDARQIEASSEYRRQQRLRLEPLSESVFCYFNSPHLRVTRINRFGLGRRGVEGDTQDRFGRDHIHNTTTDYRTGYLRTDDGCRENQVRVRF